jgi:hypothetical protein
VTYDTIVGNKGKQIKHVDCVGGKVNIFGAEVDCYKLDGALAWRECPEGTELGGECGAGTRVKKPTFDRGDGTVVGPSKLGVARGSALGETWARRNFPDLCREANDQQLQNPDHVLGQVGDHSGPRSKSWCIQEYPDHDTLVRGLVHGDCDFGAFLKAPGTAFGGFPVVGAPRFSSNASGANSEESKVSR